MKILWNKQKKTGFTLIELLIAISIIAILSSVIAINSIESGKQSRDEKRQADIRALQSAVELYKNKKGRYPEGCNAPESWSGQKGSAYQCGGGDTQYIVDLAPEFISVLPLDPKLGNGEGYVYTTNNDGTVYKIMAMETVESEEVNHTHRFASCDIDDSGSGDIEEAGWCLEDDSGSIINVCRDSNDRFKNSYGVWGGFAPLSGNNISLDGLSDSAKINAVEDTVDVICK